MVKLTLAQFKQQLGTNASRNGFHTLFLKSPSTKMMISFKDQTVDLSRRLIMSRNIVGEQKIRLMAESGDRVQLIEDSPVNGRTSVLGSFVNISEYLYDGRRFIQVDVSKENLHWQPVNYTTPQGYCTQTYIDVQRAILNDVLLNYVEITNIGFPRISFPINEKFKHQSGLAFGLVIEQKGYSVTVLSPKDDIDAYDAVVHVKLANVASITVQTHNVKNMSRIWNDIREKLLDSNMVIENTNDDQLMIIYGDPTKIDVEIVE